MLLVVRIERVAARNQPGARRSSAVAECPAQAFARQRLTSQHIRWEFRIAKDHASQTDEIRLSLPHHGLGYVRKPFLQIAVGRAHDGQIWKAFFEFSRNRDLPGYACQRVFEGGKSAGRWMCGT